MANGAGAAKLDPGDGANRAKAQRVYVLSVQQEFDKACGRETHILAPETADGMPRLNEKAMRVYDNMIAEADKQGLRLILPFIDHWWWWGGREQLAAFYHEKAEDFYRTDSKTFKAYLDVIRQVITRTNTVTGRAYYDEKAIMARETGNELEDTNADFLHQTAAWIKKWAPHQLVVDGTYKKINSFALTDPNVDIVSNHYYTNADNNHPGQVTQDLRAVGGQKVYLVGEFGLLPADQLNAIMQSIVHSDVNGAQAAGGLIWGFRGHRHDGGFYWHKESTGHYSYHLPGFAKEGEANQSRRWSIWCARPRRRWPGSRRWRRCRSRTRLCCARPPRPSRSTGWEPRWDAATMSNAPPRRPGRGRWWAGISPMALTNGIRKPWFCSATIIVSFSSGIRITTG